MIFWMINQLSIDFERKIWKFISQFTISIPPKVRAATLRRNKSYTYRSTGCRSQIRKIFEFKIWKESMLVLKQTIHQKKALNLSFNMAPWKWAWHYQEGVTMTCRKRTFFTPRAPMLFAARGRGALLIMPRPLSGCQIKAEIKGFLLMYRLFLY